LTNRAQQVAGERRGGHTRSSSATRAALVLTCVCAVAAVLLASACGATSQSGTGIYGLVITARHDGGGSPSPLPDGFGSSSTVAPDPHAEVVIVQRGTGQAAKTWHVTAGDDGTFHVTLPPGAYVLRLSGVPASFNVGASVSDGYAHVVVRAPSAWAL
jgi:hypothetical protein